jgi:predicted metal-binding protein
MQKQDSDYKVHVFVCTNQKKPGQDCCAPLGAEDLRRQLKDWTRTKPQWAGRIRINSSGCLDHCSEGIAITVYPQQKTFTGVRGSDLESLKSEIEKLMATPD